ncbi:MAG: hypothetical protein KatS3mg131_1606 [Candidatus Tectimicrobiota bacterium]|nr:MAG: hypothetical protein KatS3mg131_1606 [Candidatus Tectomicrobia bacterium]
MAVANPDLRLKSGFFARVTLAIGEVAQALLVPKDALVQQGPAGNRLCRSRRQSGARPLFNGRPFTRRMRVVTGALQPGEPVVIRGNERLRPGQPVRIARAGTCLPNNNPG